MFPGPILKLELLMFEVMRIEVPYGWAKTTLINANHLLIHISFCTNMDFYQNAEKTKHFQYKSVA